MAEYHIPEMVYAPSVQGVYDWYLARLETEDYGLRTVAGADILRQKVHQDPNASCAMLEQAQSLVSAEVGVVPPPTFAMLKANDHTRVAQIKVVRLADGQRRYFIYPLETHGEVHVFSEVPSLPTIHSLIGPTPLHECLASSSFGGTPETAKMCSYVPPAPPGDMPPF